MTSVRMKASFLLPLALSLIFSASRLSAEGAAPAEAKSSPAKDSFLVYMNSEAVWANPFAVLKARAAEIKKKQEERIKRIAEEERKQKEAVLAFLDAEWIAGNPQSFIRYQRDVIENLTVRLGQQSADIAKLQQQRDAQTEAEKKEDAALKKDIDDLRKLIQENQKKLDEQREALKKENEELKKKIDSADNGRKTLAKSSQGAINTIRERILRDFETQVFDGIDFVRIPAGSFTMGTSEPQIADLTAKGLWSRLNNCESPAHRVTITRGFFISKCEITQKQWKTAMGKNPSAFQGDDLPVESVSWEDAQKFISKLQERSGGEYRLPTEAEWEYCARAGGSGIFGLGSKTEPITMEKLSDYAWFTANSENKTHEVGKKTPNAWGLCDMLGNVWEWCQDWHQCGFYAAGPENDPRCDKAGTERVFRGGAWGLEPQHARAAMRGGNLPEFKSQFVGLRVVREIKNP